MSELLVGFTFCSAAKVGMGTRQIPAQEGQPGTYRELCTAQGRRPGP